MRIIAGAFKGRRLRSPSWSGLRPTSDRLRGTLFDVLSPRVFGARVLDGFSGTGAVGIEALSRGASHVTFVDRDRRATALIRQNLAKCGIEGRYTIVPGDFEEALVGLPPAQWFDLALLDPPYGGDTAAALEAAVAHLAPDGLLVLERTSRGKSPKAAGLTTERDLQVGDSTLTFMRPG
jgi:16S rRNA (guanine966-N2)-methyltransferase